MSAPGGVFRRIWDADHMARQVEWFERAVGVVEDMRREAETEADLLAVADVYDRVHTWHADAVRQLARIRARQRRKERLQGGGDLGARQQAAAVEGPPGSPGCGGGAPAVKGQGCPALAPAVGPAPMPCPTGEDARESGSRGLHNPPADPLFCGQQVQELPGRSDPATVTQQREGVPC